jgi:transposase
MPRGPKPTPITSTGDERAKLTGWARRPTSAQRLALRARIVLSAADGRANAAIATDLHVTVPTVRKWRDRFSARRLEGLVDEPRPGGPRTITDTQVEAAVTRTLESKPAHATHWSTRTLARELGLSQTAVARIRRAFGLKPHRRSSFNLPTDPLFAEKARDVVGLYMAPPRRAIVLCVDEIRSRPSTALSPFSRCCRADRRGPATTTSGTAPRRCSRRWTWRPVR